MQTFPVMSFPINRLCAGVEGFTSQEDQEMVSRIEKQLKRRFAIGSQVSEHSIVQDFTKQVSCCRSEIFVVNFPSANARLCSPCRNIPSTPSTKFST